MSKLQITFSVRSWTPDANGYGGALSHGAGGQVFTSWHALYREIGDADIHRNDLTVRPDYENGNFDDGASRRSGAWLAEFVEVDGSRGEVLVDGERRAETPGV